MGNEGEWSDDGDTPKRIIAIEGELGRRIGGEESLRGDLITCDTVNDVYVIQVTGTAGQFERVRAFVAQYIARADGKTVKRSVEHSALHFVGLYVILARGAYLTLDEIRDLVKGGVA